MESKSVLFSILIANFNNGHFFQECFNSIVSQTYVNWEVIVVDDDSTDDSVSVIKNIISGDERFKFYENKENKGVGYTKRRCIELATGHICGFLDSDDFLDPKALEIMINAHASEGNSSLVYSNLYYCNDKLEIKKIKQSYQVENNQLDFFNIDGAISHFVTFKKEFYNKTEGIDSYLKIAEDQDLYLKLYDIAPVVYIDENLYYYRVHNQNVSLGKHAQKSFYWHWFVIMQVAKRRNVDVGNLFYESFVRKGEFDIVKSKVESLLNNKYYLFLKKTGILKLIK